MLVRSITSWTAVIGKGTGTCFGRRINFIAGTRQISPKRAYFCHHQLAMESLLNNLPAGMRFGLAQAL
jgi:hypothetical protein